MKAIKVRYVLKDKMTDPTNRNKKELVYAVINGSWCEMVGSKKKYDKFPISLQASILPVNFGKVNKRNNYIFDQTIFDEFSKTNKGVKNKMDSLDKSITLLETNYELKNIHPTKNEFQKELKIALGRMKRTVPVKVKVLDFLLEKITEFQNKVGSAEKDRIEPNTIKSYVTLSKYIVKYQTFRNTVLTFDNFDKKMYKDFWIVQDEILRGLITIPKVEGDRTQQIKVNGFLVNGIIKYQKTFKRVLALAVKENIKIAIDLTDETLVLQETESSKEFYIDEKELEKIINYVPTTKELKIAKDYSIIASLTGMRNESMNDAFGVKIQTCKDGEYDFRYIHSKHNKTKTECIIPVLKPFEDVLKSHNYQFPKFPPNGVINSLLKNLFFELKINAIETLTYHTFKKGIIIEKKTVSEIISTHDFKGTFFSNLNNLKVNETEIDNITHPDKVKKNAMAKFYDKRDMLTKAKLFVDEVKRVNIIKQSKVYAF